MERSITKPFSTNENANPLLENAREANEIFAALPYVKFLPEATP